VKEWQAMIFGLYSFFISTKIRMVPATRAKFVFKVDISIFE
jgi:hypothetical protein